MPSQNDIRHARNLAEDARKFLLEKGADSQVACLTHEFHAGIEVALNWILEERNHRAFQQHLEMLEKMHGHMVQEATR